jgi:hypothetical protein
MYKDMGQKSAQVAVWSKVFTRHCDPHHRPQSMAVTLLLSGLRANTAHAQAWLSSSVHCTSQCPCFVKSIVSIHCSSPAWKAGLDGLATVWIGECTSAPKALRGVVIGGWVLSSGQLLHRLCTLTAPHSGTEATVFFCRTATICPGLCFCAWQSTVKFQR